MNRKEQMFEIGKICRAARINHNISQVEMSKLCDVSQALISKFESGKTGSMILLHKYYEIFTEGLDEIC